MRETVTAAIELATWAPSGDNCQPWRFVISNNKIIIINAPDSELTHLVDYQRRGTYLAHGALIENLSIALSHFGFSSDVHLFPKGEDPQVVAAIEFVKSNTEEDSLFPFIQERCTNRKPYADVPLTSEQRDALIHCSPGNGKYSVSLVEDAERRRIVADDATIMERVALETRAFHRLFFSSLNWSVAQTKERGLHIQTMELPLPVRVAFRALRYWPITKLANVVGFSKIAAKGNADVAFHSSALGIVHTEAGGPDNFVEAGRLFQRVWLTATKMGLSVQPVAGLIYLGQRVLAGNTNGIAPKWVPPIIKAYEEIRNGFGFSNGTVAMLFRVGHGGKPTARSGRLAPEIALE